MRWRAGRYVCGRALLPWFLNHRLQRRSLTFLQMLTASIHRRRTMCKSSSNLSSSNHIRYSVTNACCLRKRQVFQSHMGMGAGSLQRRTTAKPNMQLRRRVSGMTSGDPRWAAIIPRQKHAHGTKACLHISCTS